MTFRYYGAKPKKEERLSLAQRLDLLDDLIKCFSNLKSEREAATFLSSLLTEEEVRVASKRLGIAKLLLKGETYNSVVGKLKVSYASVAKLGSWMMDQRDFLRTLLSRIPNKKEIKHWSNHSQWDQFKRSHPLYFWPELLGESLDKNSQKDERHRLKRVLGSFSARSSHDREFKEEYAEGRRQKPG